MDIAKELGKLKGKETGERLNLKAGFKWICNNLEYKDFVKIFKLTGYDFKGDPFTYVYAQSPETDTPKNREDYIKYLMYKLYQNSNTPNVRFWSIKVLNLFIFVIK